MQLRKTIITSLMLGLGALPFLNAQYFQIPESQKFQKVKFELINNLMVIPVDVNGASLSFILDTGVSHPILFNLSDRDSLPLNNVSEIEIRGWGGGEAIKALKSTHNIIGVGKMKNVHQQLYVVLDKGINFSPSLGIPVHGIIGYDLFKDMVVEVNYSKKHIKFHRPSSYAPKRKKNSNTLPLAISHRRAYIHGEVTVEGDAEIPVKLLIDTGSSDAVWLFDDPEIGLTLPQTYYEDYLGRGLSGDIYGRRTRVKRIRIGEFELVDAKAAFPFMSYYEFNAVPADRNGSLGAEILRRFNVVFDYRNQQITLTKNSRFSDPFRYNMSGIALQHNGMRLVAKRLGNLHTERSEENQNFGNIKILLGNRTRISLVPEIVVTAIRAGSPAEEAGLQEGDVILAVNGKEVYNYKLQEVLEMINDRPGKRVRMRITRRDRNMALSFILKDMFQQKTP